MEGGRHPPDDCGAALTRAVDAAAAWSEGRNSGRVEEVRGGERRACHEVSIAPTPLPFGRGSIPFLSRDRKGAGLSSHFATDPKSVCSVGWPGVSGECRRRGPRGLRHGLGRESRGFRAVGVAELRVDTSVDSAGRGVIKVCAQSLRVRAVGVAEGPRVDTSVDSAGPGACATRFGASFWRACGAAGARGHCRITGSTA